MVGGVKIAAGNYPAVELALFRGGESGWGWVKDATGNYPRCTSPHQKHKKATKNLSEPLDFQCNVHGISFVVHIRCKCHRNVSLHIKPRIYLFTKKSGPLLSL